MRTQRGLKLLVCLSILLGIFSRSGKSLSQVNSTDAYLPMVLVPPSINYRVNAPYFNVDDVIESGFFREMAIFWFGKVTSYDNFTDVRIGYSNTGIYLYVAVYDRLFWYDTTPTPPELTSWDGISVYINTAGITGEEPSETSFRFDSQIAPEGSPRADYQAAYQGNNSGWTQVSVPFETIIGARGENPFNSGLDNRGWAVTYKIPYASIGISDVPANDTLWGLAVSMHDRDNFSGTNFLEDAWPPEVDLARTVTWGQMHFGLAQYTPPAVSPSGSVTIRQSNTLDTPDGDVGGHFNCGDGVDFWTEWGDTAIYLNEDGSQVGDLNVGNGADIADWPCFSKYYIKFPLDTIPSGKVILSASLTMHQFGSAGDLNDPNPDNRPIISPIQVFIVDRDYDETSLTWNTAPLSLENVSLGWVLPIEFPGWPGIPRTWDITYALAKAYRQNEPLRLALYSADNAYHSGRYFTSADVGDWDEGGRPTIQVTYGDP